MKTKKILILILSAICLCSVICFAACSGKDEIIIAPAEADYNYVYSSQYDGPSDPAVKIDGKLDEAVWQNKKWYTSKFCADINDAMPKLTVTAFNTEYGTYIGVKVRDNNILYNGMLNPSKNSTLEFYYYAEKTDYVTEDMDRSLRRAFMMDYKGELYSTGERMKRAFDIDGEINSGNTVGATVEIFIPWSEMGIDVSDGTYPQKLWLLPTYRPVLKGSTVHTPLFNKPFNPMHHINDYYIFDEDGYTDADSENAVVGDAYNGTAKSGSWDIEDLDEGVLSITDAGEFNSIFFRNAFCENFVAETTIYPLGGSPRRGGWFGGFFLLTTTGDYYTMMLDLRTERYATAKDGGIALNKYSLTTLTEAHGGDWEQVNKIVKDNPSAKGVIEKSGVKFKIIKDKNTVYYFVDDEYLYSETLDFVQGKVYAGIFNMNAYARYKEFSFKALSDDEVVDELVASDIYSVNVEVTTEGGTAVADNLYTIKGESATIKFVCESGYKLSTVLKNDADITQTIKENAVGGSYAVEDVSENIQLKVAFEKIEDPHTFKGYLRTGDTAVDGTMFVISGSNGADMYEVEASEKRGFEVVLEAGGYDVIVNNYFGSSALDITGDMQRDIQLNDYVVLDTGDIHYLNIDFVNQCANSVKGHVTEWFLVGESSDTSYLSANVYNYDLDGFTVENEDGDNVQFYFAYQGVYILKDYDWNLPDIEYEKPNERHKKYSYFNADNKGKILSAVSVDELNGEFVEIAIADGILYVSVGGTGKMMLPLNEFNENFTAETKYRLGFSTYNANATKYPSSGAMYKNITSVYGDAATGKVASVIAACEYEDYSLSGELYGETFISKTGVRSLSYYAKKAGAHVFDGVEIGQNTSFMVYADVESSFFTGVGFVVGTHGNDKADHIMFNWRPGNDRRDIYVTRESNGDKWSWAGIKDGTYPCDATVTRTTMRLALVYDEGYYMFFINGKRYLNVSESADIGWKTVISKYVGTTGNKKIGLSVLYGSAMFSDHGYTTDKEVIDRFINGDEQGQGGDDHGGEEQQEEGFKPVENAISLYEGSKLLGYENQLKIESNGSVGAFMIDGYEVDEGKNYMVSVKLDEVNAENVGFVIGTLGDDNGSHVMFDWRKKGEVNDIYIWRKGTTDWTWHGVEDESLDLSCSAERGAVTLTFVYKNGKYHLFIDSEKVLSIIDEQKFSWSTDSIKDIVGTGSKVKIGLTTSYGTATFSGFAISTDAEAIKAFVPDEQGQGGEEQGGEPGQGQYDDGDYTPWIKH